MTLKEIKNKHYYRSLLDSIKVIDARLIFSLLLAAFVGAFQSYRARGFMPKAYIPFVFFGVTLLLFLITYGLIGLINKTTFFDVKTKKLNIYKTFALYMLIIMLAWLPFFIAFFPGIMSSDSIDQWRQAIGLFPLNNHHPVTHTMIIRFSTLISGDNSPWAYSLIQYLIMSASMAFTCVWLRLKGLRKYFVWLVLAFFALHPINALYSITMWKDVLFSVSVMLFTIAIAESVLTNGKSIAKRSYFWLFLISGICVANLRNNGTLVAVLAVALIYIFITGNRRRMAIIVGAVLASALIKSLLLASFNIPESSIVESFAIPIQQVSRVVVEDGKISSKDMALIEKVTPASDIKANYAENTVDPVKFSPKFNSKQLKDYKGEYFGLWLRLLINNPSTYIMAYLEETRGYWDPMTYNWAIFFGIDKNDVGLSELEQLSVPRRYLTFYTEGVHVFLPLRFFWSGAVYGYVMLLMLAIMIFIRKNKKWLYLLATAPFMLNWLTLMVATPTANNTRYIYCSFLVFPIILALSLYDRKANVKMGNK